ncbi:MAG TPA: hypothetical protein VFY16_09450 [Gemmatimonadaceae bacterium]|jgi:hypothetical protein|nr:hypothetical protein [Gemmatimonadaceae bacterium]
MRARFVPNLLAYVVPTFALGYVWHLKLFAGYYRELGIYRPDVIVPFGLATMLLQGAVFALVYPRLVARPDSFAGGMRFAALAGVLAWSFTTLAVAAKHPMTSISGFVAIESAFTVAQFLLVGPLLAASSRQRATGVQATPDGSVQST